MAMIAVVGVDTAIDDRADAWMEAAPVLAGLAAASVQGVAATGS